MKKGKMVLVEWNDSNVVHGWMPEEHRTDIAHCRTVGILKGNNEIGVEIALGDSDCGSKFETITIPIGCITRRKELRIK